MNYFEKALLNFTPAKISKDKKMKNIAELCVAQEGAKVIGYQLTVPMLDALMQQKPSRLLAVSEKVSGAQKRLASQGKRMISLEGTLNQVQDRVFDVAVIYADSFLTEELEPLVGQAQRLVKAGGTLAFLGGAQRNMYVSLIKHLLEKSGFGQVKFMSDKDTCLVFCIKEKE